MIETIRCVFISQCESDEMTVSERFVNKLYKDEAEIMQEVDEILYNSSKRLLFDRFTLIASKYKVTTIGLMRYCCLVGVLSYEKYKKTLLLLILSKYFNMKNGNQQNPELRNYDENIKRTEKRIAAGGYESPSKKSKIMGNSRRSVEDLIEDRELREELEF